MLNRNAHDESAARTLYTSLNNRLDKLTPAGELSDSYRLAPSHVSPLLSPLLLAPAQRTFTAAELVQGGKFVARSNANSMGARAAEISSIVYPQVREVIRIHAPDTVHVFTHAGNDVPTESSRGLFVNSNYYYSALRRHAAVDNYTETIIPVDIASGTLSFTVETNLST